jgi:hypothetical protein
MSVEDPPPNSADDQPVEDDLRLSPPNRLDVPLEADEPDVLEQVLEVPPPADEA